MHGRNPRLSTSAPLRAMVRAPSITLPDPVIQQPSAMRALFAVADYRRLWTIGAAVGVARWLEFLALGVFAYEVTGSPPLVALLAMATLPLGSGHRSVAVQDNTHWSDTWHG